jgi:predicted transposase/invertase (TIGR01784 family)
MNYWQNCVKQKRYKTKDIREVLMSLSPAYEKWRQENIVVAHQEGRQEGRQETQTEIALRLLARGMAVEEVAQCTGLPIATLQTLQTN